MNKFRVNLDILVTLSVLITQNFTVLKFAALKLGTKMIDRKLQQGFGIFILI